MSPSKPTGPPGVDPLKVDLTDPEDVAAKLPEARKVARLMRSFAKQASDQADSWDTLVLVLEGVAGAVALRDDAASKNGSAESGAADQPDSVNETEDQPEASPSSRGPSSEEVVLTIVNRTRGPITTAEVRKLTPPGMKPDTATWALWKLKSDGRIRHLRKGVYAPLSYQPEEIFSSTSNSEESEE